MLHLRARWYDPNTGRFISKDPWSGSVNQPQTLNGWSYARNNSVNRVDPTGRIDWDACTIQGDTGTCYLEAGDYYYKIARLIAGLQNVNDEGYIRSVVDEMIGLNPQWQNPHNVPVGGEIKLKAEWIMMMRPGQYATPTPTPTPPPNYATPPYLPLILSAGCPMPIPPSLVPIRIPMNNVSTNVPLELIIFPEGISPVIEENRNEVLARQLSQLGRASDVAELATILLTPAGFPSIIGGVDLMLTGASSYSDRTSYIQKSPHPSLPPMTVIGQDVLVTAADLGIATSAAVLLPSIGFELGLMPGGMAGIIGAKITDFATTGASLAYDSARLEGLPSVISYALFWEDRLRQAILVDIQ